MRRLLAKSEITKLKFTFVVLVVFYSASSFARAAELFCPAQVDRSPSSERMPNGVTVIQMDPRFPTAELQQAGYSVESYAEFYHGDRWADPSPSLRDRIFNEVGIERYVRRWDQLDRDRLFLRAQSYPAARLNAKYHHVPGIILGRLQMQIQKLKAIEAQNLRNGER